MGTLHLYGAYGVSQSYEQAVRYFKMAADQGDGSGLSYLGFMYANGFGVQQNYDTAIKLFKEGIKKVNS